MQTCSGVLERLREVFLGVAGCGEAALKAEPAYQGDQSFEGLEAASQAIPEMT